LPNAAIGSSKNITPNWLSTTSTGSNGVVCASVSSNRTFGVSAATSRALSIIAASMSTPSTDAAVSAASKEVRPQPQPTSSTWSAGFSSAAAIRWGVIGASMAS
jgi:hypothetical protein